MKNSVLIGALVGALALGAGSAALGNEGVSHGGGGGTTVPTALSSGDVRYLANLSSTQITAVLRGVETLRTVLGRLDPKFRHPDFDRMFNDPKLFEKLKTIKVHVSSEKPCTDFDGNEVDASINTGAPDTICLSVQRLTSKLSFEVGKSEIPALVLHEISHLFGTTEEEAVAIQTFSRTPFSLHSADSWRVYANQMEASLDSLVMASEGTQSSLAHRVPISCTIAQKLAGLYAQTMDEYVGGKDTFMLNREMDTERYGQTEVRVAALADYLCSIDASAPADKRAVYAKAFQNRKPITATQYQEAVLWGGKHQDYDRYVANPIQITRLTSLTEASQELADVIAAIQSLKKQISDDNPSVFQTLEDPSANDSPHTIDKVACHATLYSRTADGKTTVLNSAETPPDESRIGFKGSMGAFKLVARIDESWVDESGHVVTDNPSIQLEAWPDAGGPVQIDDELVRDLGSEGRGFSDLPSGADHVSWICRLK